MPKVHWSRLELLDKDNDDITDQGQIRRYLTEYRERGCGLGWFFKRLGQSHENPEDASTWGPVSPAFVDWSGFEQI